MEWKTNFWISSIIPCFRSWQLSLVRSRRRRLNRRSLVWMIRFPVGQFVLPLLGSLALICLITCISICCGSCTSTNNFLPRRICNSTKASSHHSNQDLDRSGTQPAQTFSPISFHAFPDLSSLCTEKERLGKSGKFIVACPVAGAILSWLLSTLSPTSVLSDPLRKCDRGSPLHLLKLAPATN